MPISSALLSLRTRAAVMAANNPGVRPTVDAFGVAGFGQILQTRPSGTTRRTVENVIAQDHFEITGRGGMGQTPFVNPLQSTGPGSIPVTTNDFTASDAVLLGTAGCALLPSPQARAACLALAGAAGAIVNRGGGGTTTTTDLATNTSCPPGYKRDGQGVCRVDSFGGGRLPGDIGMPDTVWNPVAGLYGVGVTPVAVQRVQRACPTGFVLGKDGICYERLSRTQRAHNPGTKPLLSGGDVSALRRAKTLQKKIRGLNTAYGPKKPCSCGPGRKKK